MVHHMKCKKIKRKLSAYLDKELNYKEKQIVEKHLKECVNCMDELDILSNQDKFLIKIETIEPSFNFRNIFWRKVQFSSASNVQSSMKLDWFPIPVMSFLIVLIILNLSIFFFTLFARGEDLRNQITSEVVKNIVIHSHLLNPVSLLNFCQSSCEILCKCAQSQGVSSECICGKCPK